MPISQGEKPVSQSERITILDSLRGFAILGILLMNMPSFSLSGPAGHDPSVRNELGTINYSIWYFINWCMDGTQRALFSLLFGAGVLLFIGRKESKPGTTPAADYFFRRQLWLIAISTFDVYLLLWNGDILLDYAIYGMLLFAFRNMAPKKLLWVAAFCFFCIVARDNRELYLDKQMISAGEAIAKLDTSTIKLTALQKEKLGEMQDFKEKATNGSKISRMKLANEKVRGEYAEVYAYRTDRYVNSMVHYIYFQAWDVLLFMFLGMAFFKTGVLTGNAPAKVYWLLMIFGLGVGLLCSYFTVQGFVDHQFNDFAYIKSTNFSLSQLGRTFRSLGIFGLLLLLFKSNLFNWLFSLMRPVGQMALTNYLMQSLICSIVFNGFGFSLFGYLQRYEIYVVVGSIWFFQIIFCHIWMRYFQFGPSEWAWRSLTYWKKQPMRRT